VNSVVLNHTKPGSLATLNPRSSATLPRESSDPQSQKAPAASPTPAPWGLVRRFLFRFLFVYLILVVFPFPLWQLITLQHHVLPGTADMWEFMGKYTEFWDAVVPWVGEHVFQVEVVILRPNGSGDTTYDYILTFCYAAVAALAALVWSLVARRWRSHPRLQLWLTVYISFYLAANMITYGAMKFIKVQMPEPSLFLLLRPYGETSPMGVLWRFMGHSTLFCSLIGATEMIGGLLLAVRRTRLVGALLIAAVMGNVFLLNVCFDVPVKLWSAQLTAMAVLVAAPNLGRLFQFLVLQRATAPVVQQPLFRSKWLRIGAAVLAGAFVLGWTGYELHAHYKFYTTMGDGAPKPRLYGIWTVEEYLVDGQAQPPLLTDKSRWRRLLIDRSMEEYGWSGILIQGMDDQVLPYNVKLDDTTRTLMLTRMDNPAWSATLTFSEPGPDRMVLEGVVDGHRVRITLHRVDLSRLNLNRPIHWINERPYNR
jgi:hypothetical protein